MTVQDHNRYVRAAHAPVSLPDRRVLFRREAMLRRRDGLLWLASLLAGMGAYHLVAARLHLPAASSWEAVVYILLFAIGSFRIRQHARNMKVLLCELTGPDNANRIADLLDALPVTDIPCEREARRWLTDLLPVASEAELECLSDRHARRLRALTLDSDAELAASAATALACLYDVASLPCLRRAARKQRNPRAHGAILHAIGVLESGASREPEAHYLRASSASGPDVVTLLRPDTHAVRNEHTHGS